MNKLDLFVTSPTSLSNGYVEWWGLDTKLVGRVNAIIENNKELQEKIELLNEMNEKNYNNYCDAIKKINDAANEIDEMVYDYENSEFQATVPNLLIIKSKLKGEEK